MIDKRYSIAMSETLHYLKGINQRDLNKIPNKFMLFLKENASNSYSCNFDYNKPLKELKLTDEAKGLIALICLNYWCETEEQKIKFRNHLNVNEQAYQKEMEEKYSVDNLFKNKKNVAQIEQKEESVAMVEYKESIFKRFLNRIKAIFFR